MRVARCGLTHLFMSIGKYLTLRRASECKSSISSVTKERVLTAVYSDFLCYMIATDSQKLRIIASRKVH